MPARALSLALVGCMALVACGGDDEVPTEVVAGFFGVNAQALQPLPTTGRTAELERHAESLATLGVDFARANLDWRIIEPAPPGRDGHAYDFATTDAWVAALARNGVRWQVTGQGVPTPDWARDPGANEAGCDFRSPPARASDFAALMAAVADRYGRDGSFWTERPELPHEPVRQYEVWNEPNFANFWCPAPSPEAYARLYAATRAAVHEVDPEAEVVFGGLAAFREPPAGPPGTQMPVDDFLARALAEAPALARQIDVLGVHPYGQTPADVLATLAWFREVADQAGLADVPLSANEVGWRTMGAGPAPLTDEDLRATYVAEVVPAIAASGCGVIALALHTWITPEQNPVDPEHWYGIADPATAEPYPTAEAYRDAIAAVEGGEAPPQGDCAG